MVRASCCHCSPCLLATSQFRGADSEFTALEQFEREFRLYHAMRVIPMFARYRAWKCFTRWRRSVSYCTRHVPITARVHALCQASPSPGGADPEDKAPGVR